MAFVFYCFMQVLVSWDMHAAQPLCLPGCTCSEESFGRCDVLKGFQKVNRMRGSELSLGVRWSDSGLELVGNQLNLRGIHFN